MVANPGRRIPLRLLELRGVGRGVRREAGRRHGREGGEDEDNVDDELGAVGWAGLGAFGRVRAGVAGGRH